MVSSILLVCLGFIVYQRGNNGTEQVLHILQISKTGASPLDGFVSYQIIR